MMGDKARAARNAYKREWAKKNPDKVRAQQNRYWAKVAEAQARRDRGEMPTERGNDDIRET